jgi:membrane associated rhomboid family serine protease
MTDIYRIQKRKRGLFNFNINFLLIIINVACFIVFTVLISTNSNFLDYIALKPSNIISKGYLWTLLTSMFMHTGFFHIFANMISLLFVGSIIERILGKKRYILFYLFAGLFAGIFFVLSSLVLKSDFNAYAVGASGAIFALIGLLMVLTPNLPVYIMFIPIPIKIKYAAPGILILLWLISIAPIIVGGERIGIGNVAHLGGFIIGLIYGLYLRKKYKNKTKYLSKLFS